MSSSRNWEDAARGFYRAAKNHDIAADMFQRSGELTIAESNNAAAIACREAGDACARCAHPWSKKRRYAFLGSAT